jgi:hypothetical protein
MLATELSEPVEVKLLEVISEPIVTADRVHFRALFSTGIRFGFALWPKIYTPSIVIWAEGVYNGYSNSGWNRRPHE